MGFRTLILVALLLRLTQDAVYGQVGEIGFDRISPEHGLSSAQVFFLLQDRHGFIWIGTEDGLNRYDGYEFVVYRNDRLDSNSLSGNHIAALLEDSDGRLWIGTWGSGLSVYDPGSDTFRRYNHDPRDPASLSHDFVSGLAQAPNGTIYVSTWGGGLNRYDPDSNSFLHSTHRPGDSSSLSTNTLYQIRADTQGRIWIGTFLEGMNVLDPETGIVTRIALSSKEGPQNSNNVTCSLEDRFGDVWIGTWGGGLFKLDTASWSVTSYRHDARNPQSLSGNVVHSVLEDEEGRIWIGTGNGGVNLLNRERKAFRHLKSSPDDPASLGSNNNVMAILQDRGGVVWVGTGYGLSRYSTTRYKFSTVVDRARLENMSPWGMAEDRQGFLWIGTSGGDLHVVNTRTGRGRWHRLAENQPGPRPVYAVAEDAQGNIWAGTEGGGLFKVRSSDANVLRFVHDPADANSLSNNFVRCVVRDRRGFLWIGHFRGGLSRLDPKTDTFLHFRHQPGDSTSLSSDNVESIHEDHEGFLWIGTADRGLNRFDPARGVFQRYEPSEDDTAGLRHPHVRAIRQDRNGFLWIGTVGGGLVRLDPKSGRFRTYDQHHGLPNNSVYGILEDEEGHLWITTNNGLTRFTPSTDVFKTYTALDGLQSNEFNYNSYLQASSGIFYVGGVGGVNAFRPGRIPESVFRPPVVLTSFRVFDKPYKGALPHLLQEVILSYNENFFSFEFASLDYSNPRKNRYMYMLEGVDQEWHQSDVRRYGNYTHLDPGSYVLRVRGSNSDGLWSEADLALAITITPPFWQTWWFRTVAALLVVGVVYSAYRYRIRRLQEMHAMRLRIASDLHDEIGSNLSTIVVAADMLNRKKDISAADHPALAEITSTALRTTDAMREIVWFINPEHDHLDDLLLRMKDVAMRLLGDVRYEFRSPASVPEVELTPEARRDIFLIFKEALTNSVRHANATKVTIDVTFVDGMVRLDVADNGAGFSRDRITMGEGLKNLQRRAEAMGAELTVSSAPGKGTVTSLTVKTTHLRGGGR